MIELLSVNPARVLSLPGGTLAEGAPATSPSSRRTCRSRSSARGAAVEVEEHAVRRLAASRGGVAATIVGGTHRLPEA